MPRPLSILLLPHNVVGVGTYNRFRGLARSLAAMGHQVDMLVGGLPSSNQDQRDPVEGVTQIITPGITPVRFRNAGLDPVEVCYRVLHTFKKRYDIVHVSDHRPVGLLPGLAARFIGHACYISDWADLWGKGGIVEERNQLLRGLLSGAETLLENAAHRQAHGVTVISSYLYERALGLGKSPDRVLMFHNGADTDRIELLSKADIRRELGLPVSAHVVLFAGSASIDLDLVWESFRIIHDQMPDTYLVVLGREWQMPKLLGRAMDHIVQLGDLPRTAYARALSAADVMILPYRNRERNLGRWPGKLSDYMAAGRPTIANPTGDIVSLFEERRIGLLAPEDPHLFAEAAISLLNNKALAEQLGTNARQTALELFDWSKIAGDLTEFYYRCLRDTQEAGS